MEDTLIATKLRKLCIGIFSSTIFGDQYMSRVTQAVSQRHCKESKTIVYETIPPGVLKCVGLHYVNCKCGNLLEL